MSTYATHQDEHTHTHARARGGTHMHACTCTHTYTHAHAERTHARARTHTHTHTHVHTYEIFDRVTKNKCKRNLGGCGGFFLACEELGEESMIHSPPALFFFFFKVEISSCTPVPLFRRGSDHCGSAKSYAHCYARLHTLDTVVMNKQTAVASGLLLVVTGTYRQSSFSQSQPCTAISLTFEVTNPCNGNTQINHASGT